MQREWVSTWHLLFQKPQNEMAVGNQAGYMSSEGRSRLTENKVMWGAQPPQSVSLA